MAPSVELARCQQAQCCICLPTQPRSQESITNVKRKLLHGGQLKDGGWGYFFIQLFLELLDVKLMNGWVRLERASHLWHGKGPSWVIKYTVRLRALDQAGGTRAKEASEVRCDKAKVLKCFSPTFRRDVVLTTNMTPPRGEWMCTRAYRVSRADRVAFPLAKRVLGLQSALSVHADDGQWSVSLSPRFCSQMAVESREQKDRVGWSSILSFLHF